MLHVCTSTVLWASFLSLQLGDQRVMDNEIFHRLPNYLPLPVYYLLSRIYSSLIKFVTNSVCDISNSLLISDQTQTLIGFDRDKYNCKLARHNTEESADYDKTERVFDFFHFSPAIAIRNKTASDIWTPAPKYSRDTANNS